ncbi:MAG TPA: GGDEF domain-containing protein [Myxococcaceae bacterium]|nr:GGDEF domain-containing protein [Myxococcaceae bacterium]
MDFDDEKTNVLSLSRPRTALQRQPAYVTVFRTHDRANIGRMYKLEDTELVIGRSPDVEVHLEDDGISRRHAKIVSTADGDFQIVDLGSTNGTWVDERRVQTARLRHGALIQIGTNTVLKFIQDPVEEKFQRDLYESAVRDGLTRAYNKKFFEDTLRREFSACLRHQLPLALVLFDLDHFKRINDTYGHPAGDEVLRRVAERVSATVRAEDLFARYGGEEFAVLLRDASGPQALIAAERLRSAIADRPIVVDGQPLPVTISVGVAILGQGDTDRPEALIDAADRALYRAKREGRNRVSLTG